MRLLKKKKNFGGMFKQGSDHKSKKSHSINEKPHRGEAISFIISTLVRNCGDNSGRQFLTERHNKSRKFLVLLFAKIVISIVVITANIFQGCAITHHNLANSRCRY